jgi:hypothetical protein
MLMNVIYLSKCVAKYISLLARFIPYIYLPFIYVSLFCARPAKPPANIRHVTLHPNEQRYHNVYNNSSTCHKFLQHVMYSSRMVHSSDRSVQMVMAKAVQMEKNRAHGPTRHRLGNGASTSKCTKECTGNGHQAGGPCLRFCVCFLLSYSTIKQKN